MKIFLLEEEIMLNESICEFLEMEGHIVDSFVDGGDAYENITKTSCPSPNLFVLLTCLTFL